MERRAGRRLGAGSSTSCTRRARRSASSSATPAARPRPTRPGWAAGSVPVTGGGWEAVGPSALAFEGYATPRARHRGRPRRDRRGVRRRGPCAPRPPGSTSSRSTPRTAICCTSSCRRWRTGAPTTTAALRQPGPAPARGRRRRARRLAGRPARCSSGSRRRTGSTTAGRSRRRRTWPCCCASAASTWSTSPPAAWTRRQQITVGPGYQVPFARHVRDEERRADRRGRADHASRTRRRGSSPTVRRTSCCSRGRRCATRRGRCARRRSWSRSRSATSTRSPTCGRRRRAGPDRATPTRPGARESGAPRVGRRAVRSRWASRPPPRPGRATRRAPPASGTSSRPAPRGRRAATPTPPPGAWR